MSAHVKKLLGQHQICFCVISVSVVVVVVVVVVVAIVGAVYSLLTQ